MIRIADKVVIIVFGYLRMISNSKGVLFTNFLKEIWRKVGWNVIL
jgi:hypothetical protein